MLMLPPDIPSTMRAAKTTAIGATDSATAMFGASPSIAQPIVAPIWLTISTVLRPSRSEMIPQSGADDELAERERREEQSDDEWRGAEVRHEVRQHRNQHAEADDVDERDAENRQQLANHARTPIRRLFRRLYRQDDPRQALASPQNLDLIGAAQIDARQHMCSASTPRSASPSKESKTSPPRRPAVSAGLPGSTESTTTARRSGKTKAPRNGGRQHDVLCRDAEVAAPHASVAHQQTGNVLRRINRDRKAEPLTGKHRGVHADDFAGRVDERTTRVSRIERRVGLNDVVHEAPRLRPQRATERADDAGGHRIGEAVGITDRDDELAGP